MRENKQNAPRVKLWVGFSRYQTPAQEMKTLLEDSAKSLALVFTVLYSIGGHDASRSLKEREVIVKVTLKTLASRTGLSEDTIQRCLKELERRKLIHKWKRRTRGKTGRLGSNIYSLLHPLTGDHLRVVLKQGAQKQGLCFSNGIGLYVASPHYFFRKAGIFSRLTVAQQNAMLAALILASEFKSMMFPVSKLEWRETANLTRKYFGPAVDRLCGQGLLSYDGRTLTLFDPETRAESQRAAHGEVSTKRLRVKGTHDWFDYDSVTAVQWETILRDVLPHRTFETYGGWSHRALCPLNHHERECFAVNFEAGCYQCFKCGGGKLSRLVKTVKNLSDTQTKNYIASMCGVTLEERTEGPMKLLEAMQPELEPVMVTADPYGQI
jgi:hypothetical protein